MDKKEQELRQSVADLKAAAETFMNEGKQEEAKAKIQEAKDAKASLDNYLEVKNLQVPDIEDKGGQMKEMKEQPKAQYVDVFLKAVRGKKLDETEMAILDEFKAAVTGGTDEDGGLIIPEDISTRINEMKRQFNSLEEYITVEPVSTRSGSRVLERNAEMVPFENITNELDPINEFGGPKFDPMSYQVSDYAGILPVSNTLLSDTDQNLSIYLAKWIGKKSVVTRNTLILNVLGSLAKKTFNNLDDIKDTLNVELDPAISNNAIALTNQDGFNYLDKLKDSDGDYVLQPNPSNPTQKLLFGKPVVVVSNRHLKTETNLAPVIVGDLKEAVVMFDRQKYSIKTTDVGGDAFKRNSTDMRVIEREDVKLWDAEAVVYGQVDITPAV
jgi:HK97 family phage major capsid protein